MTTETKARYTVRLLTDDDGEQYVVPDLVRKGTSPQFGAVNLTGDPYHYLYVVYLNPEYGEMRLVAAFSTLAECAAFRWEARQSLGDYMQFQGQRYRLAWNYSDLTISGFDGQGDLYFFTPRPDPHGPTQWPGGTPS